MRGEDVHAHTRTSVDGEDIVAVTGQIDMSTAAAFQQVLEEAARGRDQLTVDLTGLGFLDSAGIKVLFDLAARVELRLIIDPRSVIATTLDVCGLPQVSTIREG
ncbi:MAG TPA: STAS domain-containing protein [Pseudonocardiaceae bacterium]|nr:STAS domain-containing protein [Pseudonocardiaceae bacterium]